MKSTNELSEHSIRMDEAVSITFFCCFYCRSLLKLSTLIFDGNPLFLFSINIQFIFDKAEIKSLIFQNKNDRQVSRTLIDAIDSSNIQFNLKQINQMASHRWQRSASSKTVEHFVRRREVLMSIF